VGPVSGNPAGAHGLMGSESMCHTLHRARPPRGPGRIGPHDPGRPGALRSPGAGI